MAGRKKTFPNEIFVYQIDEVEGHPVYAVATDLDAIEPDVDGERVASYFLDKEYKFSIRRELK